MAEGKRRRALLGRLAHLGWFARHGEVAATQALAMLLEEPQLNDALLRHLGQITNSELGAVASFRAELVHHDRARPDLEGQDSWGRPLVVVEAKFGAVPKHPFVLALRQRTSTALSDDGSPAALIRRASDRLRSRRIWPRRPCQLP